MVLYIVNPQMRWGPHARLYLLLWRFILFSLSSEQIMAVHVQRFHIIELHRLKYAILEIETIAENLILVGIIFPLPEFLLLVFELYLHNVDVFFDICSSIFMPEMKKCMLFIFGLADILSNYSSNTDKFIFLEATYCRRYT